MHGLFLCGIDEFARKAATDDNAARDRMVPPVGLSAASSPC